MGGGNIPSYSGGAGWGKFLIPRETLGGGGLQHVDQGKKARMDRDQPAWGGFTRARGN